MRRPRWCLAGGVHAGTGTGQGSVWLLVRSEAAPSAEGASLPKSKKKIVVVQSVQVGQNVWRKQTLQIENGGKFIKTNYSD